MFASFVRARARARSAILGRSCVCFVWEAGRGAGVHSNVVSEISFDPMTAGRTRGLLCIVGCHVLGECACGLLFGFSLEGRTGGMFSRTRSSRGHLDDPCCLLRLPRARRRLEFSDPDIKVDSLNSRNKCRHLRDASGVPGLPPPPPPLPPLALPPACAPPPALLAPSLSARPSGRAMSPVRRKAGHRDPSANRSVVGDSGSHSRAFLAGPFNAHTRLSPERVYESGKGALVQLPSISFQNQRSGPSVE